MKIRYKKMFCVGLIYEDRIIGGFIEELSSVPEVIQFFLWKFANKRGFILFYLLTDLDNLFL